MYPESIEAIVAVVPERTNKQIAPCLVHKLLYESVVSRNSRIVGAIAFKCSGEF